MKLQRHHQNKLLGAGTEYEFNHDAIVKSPTLWSVETPELI